MAKKKEVKSVDKVARKIRSEVDFNDVFNTTTPEEVMARNKEARENFGKFLPYFNQGKDEVAVLRFLDDEPITFYQHRVKDATIREGAGGWRTLTCARKNCPLCDAGDRPRYVGAFRIVHIDNIENGKLVPKLKIFIKGINTLELLERKNRKKKLSAENMEIERVGEGFDTKYLFEWTGEKKVPAYEKPETDDLKEIFRVQLDVLQRLAQTYKSRTKEPDADEVDEAEEEEDSSSKSKRAKSKVPF